MPSMNGCAIMLRGACAPDALVIRPRHREQGEAIQTKGCVRGLSLDRFAVARDRHVIDERMRPHSRLSWFIRPHMGSFGSRAFHLVMCQTPTAVSVSEVRARLHDAARFRARSTSHTVAVRDGCTNIPLPAGRGSGGRNHSIARHFRPWPVSVRPPGSAGTDQVPEDLRIC